MNISNKEYFFFEWLVLEKEYSEKAITDLTLEKWEDLYKEYKKWENS